MDTLIFSPQTKLTDFLIFPRTALDLPLNETTKLMYMILLDRARLSAQNGWVDGSGHVYVNYTISQLAKTLKKKESCIKAGLLKLETLGLIIRERQGVGRPNKIYVLVDKSSTKAPAKKPPDSPNPGDQDAGNPAPSNNCNNPDLSNLGSKDTAQPYGPYNNVYLTPEDYDTLRKDIPNLDDIITTLSLHMASTGRTYKDHAATIRLWYHREQLKPKPQYPRKGTSAIMPSGELGTAELEAIQRIIESDMYDVPDVLDEENMGNNSNIPNHQEEYP